MSRTVKWAVDTALHGHLLVAVPTYRLLALLAVSTAHFTVLDASPLLHLDNRLAVGAGLYINLHSFGVAGIPRPCVARIMRVGGSDYECHAVT